MDAVTQWIVVENRHGDMLWPLDYEARQSIKRWIDERDTVSHNALFVTHKGQPMGKRAFQDVVPKYFELAKISNASLNSLRHTFAVNYLAQGQDLNSLKNAMGFAHVADAYRYLRLVHDDLKMSDRI